MKMKSRGGWGVAAGVGTVGAEEGLDGRRRAGAGGRGESDASSRGVVSLLICRTFCSLVGGLSGCDAPDGPDDMSAAVRWSVVLVDVAGDKDGEGRGVGTGYGVQDRTETETKRHSGEIKVPAVAIAIAVQRCNAGVPRPKTALAKSGKR